jgi:hypothetical protein
MEVRAFLALVAPFIVVFYLAVLLFLRPSRVVLLASLLGGLVMGVINVLADVVAYYAHWWHYTLKELTLHVPLPFYITPVLIYGSIVYLLIWRYWTGRGRWFALLMLIGVPLFGMLRDILGTLTTTSYTTYDSTLGIPLTVVLWLAMFYAGYYVFRTIAPSRESLQEEANNHMVLR